MAHCNQCGKDWEPRVPVPVCCPRCKRYDWNGGEEGGQAMTFSPYSPIAIMAESRVYTFWVCPVCSALVEDTELHDYFHELQEDDDEG